LSRRHAEIVNVLHLSQFDERGGAARSSYRLHDSLRRLGVASRMLVQTKTSDDPDVDVVPHGFADRVVNRLEREAGIQYAYLPSGPAVARHPWVRDADVLQLGNIHGGYLGITALPALARGKRVFWTLHDMWPLTGHCGFASCDRWLVGCGSCPDLEAYPPVKRDATHFNWRLKRRVYAHLNLTLVSPSEWLAGLARRSPLLGRFPTHVVPYGVDTDLFAPVDRSEARARLGLQPEGRLLFVAGVERRKGSELLAGIVAAAAAESGARPTLLVAGEPYAPLPRGVPTHLLGAIDEATMRDAYAAADVYVLPTLLDNLPNSVLEALSCGAAIVASNVGGIPEAIEDGVHGLLRPPDAGALGQAAGLLLRDPALAATLGAQGRATALRRFPLDRQARAYRDLYVGGPVQA
jgi:glycosyltransferase involved in cell wall biosynthesis